MALADTYQDPELDQLLGTPQSGGQLPQMQQPSFEQLKTSIDPSSFLSRVNLNDSDYDLMAIRTIALTRAAQARQPTPRGLTRNPRQPLDPAAEVAARQYELLHLQRVLSTVGQIQQDRKQLQAIRQMYPEVAEAAGLSDDWMENVKRIAYKNAHRGWTAVDFLLRNLDRGRGAVAAYALSKTQGGTEGDARRKAWDAFRGSSQGWVFVPENQAPSFKEVLTAAGMDEDWTTKSLGFSMDVLVDPVNILGVGVINRATRIGTHQFLNAEGRALHGEMLRRFMTEAKTAHEVEAMSDLPHAVVQQVYERANSEMRNIVNSSYDEASKYLDLGGLKLAGVSLLGDLHLREAYQQVRGGKGIPQKSIVALGMPTIIGKNIGDKLFKLGTYLTDTNEAGLAARLGELMKYLPENLKNAGEALGSIIHRTNPAAGEEYRLFKQTHYYDRLSWENLRVAEMSEDTFRGIMPDDRIRMTRAIDSGTLPLLIKDLNDSRGAEYAAKVEQAANVYRLRMDAGLAEEVRKGIFPDVQGWSTGKRNIFAQWISDPTLPLPPDMLEEFRKVRLDNYVPHFYHNFTRYRKLFPKQSVAGGVSIVEPFANRRAFATLEEAQEKGLVPEMDLAKLMAIRLGSAYRAIGTHEFLEGVSKEFGVEAKSFSKDATAMYTLAGERTPVARWQEVATMRRTASGGLPASTAKQIVWAREMGKEAFVPLEAVAALDEAAKREFLIERLRQPRRKEAEAVWNKYVVEATRQGKYNGFKVAPGDTFEKAWFNVRDVQDPFYTSWTVFKAGGFRDPEILTRTFLPAPIARDLERLKPSGIAPELRYLLRFYDIPMSWWKRSVTLFWPAFHVRNKFTNVLNSMMDIGLGGVLNRGDMWHVMNGGEGKFVAENGLEYGYGQVRQLMRRYGVVQPVYRRSEITEIIDDLVGTELGSRAQLARDTGVKLPNFEGRQGLAAKGEAVGPASIANPLLAPSIAARDVALTIENSDRAQLFIASLKRGMSPEQAASRVSKFLFDYDDISNVERNIVRRMFFPFWTWSRKNLALQAETVFKAPRQITTFGKFAKAFSEEKDDWAKSYIEKDLLPSFLNDHFAIRLDAGRGWSKYLMNIDLPQNDLDRLWDENYKNTIVKNWFAQIGPGMRTFLESTMDYDFYKGKTTVELKGQMKGADILEKAPKVIKDFLQLQRVQRRDEHVLLMNRNRWMALQAFTLWTGSRVYTTISHLTDPNSTNSAKLLNFLTGVKVSYLRPEEELRRTAESIIRNPDTGIAKAYKQELSQIKDILQERAIQESTTLQQLHALEQGVNTPDTPDEMSGGL